MRPKRIHCSIRFSNQINSTCVRALSCTLFGGAGELASLRGSIMFGEFAGEQRAQHVGDGEAALKRGDLDPAAQRGVTSIVSRAV